ncbi:MAG: hypothetical protein CVV24_11965 [Ignavibacteriae bacterium HGW-Ignavibacteriae-3]|nr:MAG: hypothetical protein CVV24_11965 [Ignavibacteriae bacterium HGW-Ignavibacteriae-3]
MIKTMLNKNVPSNWGRKYLPKFLRYAGYAIGSLIIIGLLTVILFSDSLLNAFLKDKITKSFSEAYPAYSLQLGDMHYNIWKNRLGCDSITLNANDSTFTGSAASFYVSGMGWMKIFLQSDSAPNTLKTSVIDAKKILLSFHSTKEEIIVGSLHISVPDSELIADSIKYYSLINDEQFFAKSRYRQTRFRIEVPQLKVIGLDYFAMMQKNKYKAKNITINDVFADILVNMDKPYDKNSPDPQMPNELLSKMKETVEIDSLKIINGRLKYSERYAVNARPGVITFGKVNLSVSGIANHTLLPDSATVVAEGLFMNTAKMKLLMKIPLASTDFSLHYSGSLNRMDLTRLNEFIEAGEHRRIKSGILNSASFNINVHSGRASGTLRAEYKDLSIAILNEETGSEKGIFNRILSFVGKVFVIRGTNLPDEKGIMKIGEVRYVRNPADYFLQYLWFALRSSVADAAGFPPEDIPDK